MEQVEGPQIPNLRVDDDLQAVGVEHTTDVHVELVKFVDGLSRAHVPQHAVVQNQVVCGVEGGAVPLVVVGQTGVVQGQGLLTRLDVVDMGDLVLGADDSVLREFTELNIVVVYK